MTEGDLESRLLALRASLQATTAEAHSLAEAAAELEQPELDKALVWLGETLESAAESMSWERLDID